MTVSNFVQICQVLMILH